MVNELIKRLEGLIVPEKIPDKLAERVHKLAKPVAFEAGEFILRSGEVCRGAYFLLKGLARSYYAVDDKEVTSRLMEEGFIITSWLSFYRQQPATEYIVAMEDCKTIFLSYRDINSLYKEFPVFNLIGRKQVEYSFCLSEMRTQLLRGVSAQYRYATFCRSYPSLAKRVPLKYIASYLGMNAVTLSRLRGKFKKYGEQIS